jgi:DNA-3-methyladenine glycosylase II
VTVTLVHPVAPYDLALSLRAAACFAPEPARDPRAFRAGLRIGGVATVMTVEQVSRRPCVLRVESSRKVRATSLAEAAAWMLLSGLDLRPFYRRVRAHSILGPLTARMRGLKPLRPATLFEMIAVAITEQQISLSAAYRIRQRLIERFGKRVGGMWVFPGADTVAAASPASLRGCGLSRSKAGYLHALAKRAASGALNLERLKTLDDDRVRAELLGSRGLGPWSAEYILVRGLGRPDAVPYDDLALGRVVGFHLGAGRRFTPIQVRRALLPFTPYRGLAAFYLLVHDRLGQ